MQRDHTHNIRSQCYGLHVVDNLFSSLGLDKAEWLEDIRKGVSEGLTIS